MLMANDKERIEQQQNELLLGLKNKLAGAKMNKFEQHRSAGHFADSSPARFVRDIHRIDLPVHVVEVSFANN